MLSLGVLQADCHPGNILVTPGGCETVATGFPVACSLLCFLLRTLKGIMPHSGSGSVCCNVHSTAAVTLAPLFWPDKQPRTQTNVCLCAVAPMRSLLVGMYAPSSGCLLVHSCSSYGCAHPSEPAVSSSLPCWPADGHVGLLDYGQSKQLPRRDKLALATLIIALTDGDTLSISEALTRLGVATTKEDPEVRAQMAVGMFDTLGR